MLHSRKSFGKVNIFLKVTGKRGTYHEFLSRFMRLENLYDDVEFIPSMQHDFVLDGNFSCSLEENTIYRTYLALLEQNMKSNKIKVFFRKFKVTVLKRIPEFGGFGGGSSNAATFLQMANDLCCLGLGTEELCHIGQSISADLPFFLYNAECANVSGIGEIVEVIDEAALNIKYITPTINCNTGNVYRNFREKHYKELSLEEFEELKTRSSMDILQTFDARSANDLCESALELYPELEKYIKQGWFLTGSGSSVFALNV